MKVDYCLRERVVTDEGRTRQVTQFAVTWTAEDVLEDDFRLPLFTERAETTLSPVMLLPEGLKRVTAYYHVSADGRRMFGKFVDEEV